MLSIILSACLVSDPNVCKDYKIPLSTDLDPTKCALYAPPHFAQWAEQHPGWQIKKWECTAGDSNDI